MIQGTLRSVSIRRLGSSVAIDAPAGALTLYVHDVYDFDEDGGEVRLIINDDNTDPVLSYTTIIEQSDQYDVDENGNHVYYGALVLDPETPLPDAITGVGEALQVSALIWPLGEEKVAEVYIENDVEYEFDDDASEDIDASDKEESNTITVRVSHAVASTLSEGFRTTETGFENVILSEEEGSSDFVLTEVLGTPPVFSAEYIDPESTIPVSALTDGDPPDTAPVITVETFAIKALLISWTRISNPDPTQYKVYGSTSPTVEPGPDTYIGITASDSYVVSHMPDGSEVSAEVPSYFVVVASDPDGDGPTSNEEAGIARLADESTISAGYVYAGIIDATKINAGDIFARMVKSGAFSTGDTDPRVYMDSLGVFATDQYGVPRFELPTDPNKPAEFKGKVTAESIVGRRIKIMGLHNEFSKGSRTILAAATSAPNELPSMSETFPAHDVAPNPYEWNGAGLKKFSDGKWYGFLGIWGGAWDVYRLSEDGNGNLVNREVILSYNNSQGGAWQLVQDILEWNGHLLVLMVDHDIDHSYVPTKYLIRSWDFNTLQIKPSHMINMPESSKKIAMSASSQSNILAIGCVDYVSKAWRIRGFQLNLTTGNPPGGYTHTFDHTLLAGRDEDIDTLQYAPTTSTNPSGSGFRWYIKSRGSACLFAFNPSTRERATLDEANITPISNGIIGSVWYDGTRWHAYQGTKIYHLSTLTWSGTYASKKRVWARYSWFDESTLQGTTQHESLVSDAQGLYISKLAHFRVTTAELPAPDDITAEDSVTGVRIWLKYDSVTEPPIGSFGRASADIPRGVTSVVYGHPLDVSISPPNSSIPPPFPSGSPAVFRSEASDSNGPIINLSGDGSGRVGPYSWNSQGVSPAEPYIRLSKSAGGGLIPAWAVVSFQQTLDSQGGIVFSNNQVTVPRNGLYSINVSLLLSATTAATTTGVSFVITNNTYGNFTDYFYETKGTSPTALSAGVKGSGVYRLSANAVIGVEGQSTANPHTFNMSNAGFNNWTVTYIGRAE